MTPPRSLDPIFRPRSIAVVGASRRPNSIGRELIRNLIEFEYAGKVFPVNPKADVIASMKCYRSVSAIPDPIDLAVLVVPNDLLEYWEDDPDVRLILMYLESFGNPAKFIRLARRVSRIKPILTVKSGRTEAGARAASSHTGSIVGRDLAVESLLDQSGVLRVSTMQELFTLATAFSLQPIPKGNRVGIVTNAGGPGILATDEIGRAHV